MTVTSGWHWLSERAVLKPDGMLFRARPVHSRKKHLKLSRTEPVRVEGPFTVTSLPRSTPNTRRARDGFWARWNGRGALAPLANEVLRNGRLSRARSASATRCAQEMGTRVSPRITLGTLRCRLTDVHPPNDRGSMYAKSMPHRGRCQIVVCSDVPNGWIRGVTAPHDGDRARGFTARGGAGERREARFSLLKGKK